MVASLLRAKTLVGLTEPPPRMSSSAPPMFRGINNATLDSKGRMALPTRNREVVSAAADGKVVVTIDVREACLLLYPLPEWETREQQLMNAPSLDPRAQSLQRLYVGYATEVNFDSQGRILIPPSLRKFAGLEKQAVLVGQGHKFELWDEQRWSDNQAAWLQTLSDVSGADLPDALKDFSF